MHKHLHLAIVGIVIAGVSFCAGAVINGERTRQATRREMTLEEISWIDKLLFQKNLSPQLREYLKSKFYYDGVRVPERDLRRFLFADRGPVDQDVLAGIKPAPLHADNPANYYDWFMERYRKRPSP